MTPRNWKSCEQTSESKLLHKFLFDTECDKSITKMIDISDFDFQTNSIELKA